MSSLARRKFGKAGTAGFAVPPPAADLGAADGLYGGGGGGIPVNFGESRTAAGLPRPVVVGGLEDEEFAEGMPLKKLGLGGVGMVSKSSMGAQTKQAMDNVGLKYISKYMYIYMDVVVVH